MASYGSQGMVAPLKRVIVKRPEEAFQSAESIEKEWTDLDYLRPPDLQLAIQHHQAFVSLVTQCGAQVLNLPSDNRTGLDSLYVHDPILITDRGAVILQTGKAARRGEGPAFETTLQKWDVPILGRIEGEATAEAGDMLWLDPHTLLVGRGFRTNAAGVEALRKLLSPLNVDVISYDMPFWNGPREVLHLQSFISLLDDDLAVVYRRLLPVAMFELLNARGVQLIDVTETEYDSLACNILAIAPRNAVMVAGNPITRSRIEAAGCKVSEFDGSEICYPGSGGPTCLTRPLLRG
jgi:N-dimethylarginine dimethylaminohydrolase